MRKRIRIRQNADGLDEAVVNLTPLIDIVFVVLIMFIVVAPILEVDQVQLASGSKEPREHSSSAQKNSPISIHVLKDNTIWYNKRLISAEELTSQLLKAKRQFPNEVPQIFHDRQAQFGTYQSVKNAVEAAGFSDMDVILKPA